MFALLTLAAAVAWPAAANEAAPVAPSPADDTPLAAEAWTAVEEHRAQTESPPTEPAETSQRRRFPVHLYWQRGLNYVVVPPRVRPLGERMLPVDERPRLSGRIGIKLGVDTAGYLERGSLPEMGTQLDLRRAFLTTTGEFRFLVPILFKLELGGVGDSPYLNDSYLWLRDVPYVGTIKLGYFDAPMSLEALTGSTNETFLEYGSPVAAFAPGLKAGLQIADHTRNQRATWAFGYFTDGPRVDVGDSSTSISRLNGRVTWLAIQPRTEADTLLHLGLSASYVLSPRDRVRYGSRPESFLAPKLVDTGSLDANDALPFGLELAVKRGPLTIQAEYLASAVNFGPGDSAYFDGVYASASWFFTGEQRPYDATVGQMGPLVPADNLEPCAARWGAWEVAMRGSWLDLTDGRIRGGRMAIVTGGINWYWNRYIRILFNSSFARVDDGPNDGHLGILQSRFQLAF